MKKFLKLMQIFLKFMQIFFKHLQNFLKLMQNFLKLMNLLSLVDFAHVAEMFFFKFSDQRTDQQSDLN